MFQELDQFPFSGNSEEIHTKYGLAAWADIVLVFECEGVDTVHRFNPLKPELNSICYLLALLGAHHFLHVSRIRVKLLTLGY